MSFVISAEFNYPSSKLSQYLTEEIFPLTRTREDNLNLSMPPHAVTAGEGFRDHFLTSRNVRMPTFIVCIATTVQR